MTTNLLQILPTEMPPSLPLRLPVKMNMWTACDTDYRYASQPGAKTASGDLPSLHVMLHIQMPTSLL